MTATAAQKIYRKKQKILRQMGRAARKKRTHQLITIGMAWQHFLRQHNLAMIPEIPDPKKFESLLNKLSEDENIMTIVIFDDLFYMGVTNDDDLHYYGHNKTYIHYLCSIGGAWESFYKKMCRNNPREKIFGENIT